MSIESCLKALEKSSAFQAKVKAAHKAALKSGKTFGRSVRAADHAEIQQQVDSILQAVRVTVQENFPSIPADMFRVYGPFPANDGCYEYRIFFEPSTVHRESLYHEGYPDGLENVLVLYSHGSKPAKNPVWNTAAREWDYNRKRQFGEYRQGRHIFIREGWHVEPNSFLRDRIDALNAQYAKDNVKIRLDSRYYP